MTPGGLPARQHGHRRLTPPACMQCMQCMHCLEFCFTCIRCLHAKHIAPLKGGGLYMLCMQRARGPNLHSMLALRFACNARPAIRRWDQPAC